MAPKAEARRWFVSGRVQGVGFRWFVRKNAAQLGLKGWVSNEDDGRVQVYAIGPPDLLNRLAARLHTGPDAAIVRNVEEQPAAVEPVDGFDIE